MLLHLFYIIKTFRYLSLPRVYINRILRVTSKCKDNWLIETCITQGIDFARYQSGISCSSVIGLLLLTGHTNDIHPGGYSIHFQYASVSWLQYLDC